VLKFTRLADDLGFRVYSVDGVHPDQPLGHLIYVPTEALNDRKMLYGATDDDDAVTHIMWEHHVRLNPNMPDNIIPANIKANFDRVWGPGHKAARGMAMSQQEKDAQLLRMNTIQRKARDSNGGRNPIAEYRRG